MNLLDLPPEILDEVIEWSMPLGFESLAFTCKTLYTRAVFKTSLHNLLTKRWRHFRHDGWPRLNNNLRVLHEIAKEPLIARYIESLELWDRRPDDYTGQLRFAAREQCHREQEECLDAIERFLTRSPGVMKSLQDAGADFSDWWDHIKEESEQWGVKKPDYDNPTPYIDVTILLLLPNIKTLRLSSPSWKPRRTIPTGILPDPSSSLLRSVLDVLAKNSRGPSFEGKALGRLQTVLPFMDHGYGKKAALESVQSFLQISTVTEAYFVSCFAVTDSPVRKELRWHGMVYPSNVRRLELLYCCIDHGHISNLLEFMPKLEVFRYGHEEKWDRCQNEWNAGLFFDAVAKHCGTTITELAITHHSYTSLMGIPNGISDFHNLPKLKKLEVDVRAFCGPPTNSGQVRGWCGSTPKGVKMWTEEELPCLATILPISIEEVHVNIEYVQRDDSWITKVNSATEALLRNFKQERPSRCPNLSKVVFRQHYKSITFRSLVEGEGCEFEVSDGIPTKPFLPGPRELYMPLWIREFEDIAGTVHYAR